MKLLDVYRNCTGVSRVETASFRKRPGSVFGDIIEFSVSWKVSDGTVQTRTPEDRAKPPRHRSIFCRIRETTHSRYVDAAAAIYVSEPTIPGALVVFFIFFILPMTLVKALAVTKLLKLFRLWPELMFTTSSSHLLSRMDLILGLSRLCALLQKRHSSFCCSVFFPNDTHVPIPPHVTLLARLVFGGNCFCFRWFSVRCFYLLFPLGWKFLIDI